MRVLLHRLSGLRAERRMDREIGRRMRSLRLQSGVSLADLASEAGHRSRNWSRGRDAADPISRALLLCRSWGSICATCFPLRSEGGVGAGAGAAAAADDA